MKVTEHRPADHPPKSKRKKDVGHALQTVRRKGYVRKVLHTHLETIPKRINRKVMRHRMQTIGRKG